jgi:hypothetical protein
MPISICEERGIFKEAGLKVKHVLVPEGTGKMVQMLEDDEVDVAFPVSDALMVGIGKGRQVELIGTFASSPLQWAALVGSSNSELNSLADLSKLKDGARIGISRPGSGSHTMAYYMAKQHGLKRHNLGFSPANDFTGLKTGVNNKEFDVFLWEIFTSLPSINNGEIKSIGLVPTPWSAFSIATGVSSSGSGTPNIEKDTAIRNFLQALSIGSQVFSAAEERQVWSQRIAQEFGHKQADAQAWLESVTFSHGMAISKSETQRAIEVLQSIELLPQGFHAGKLWQQVEKRGIPSFLSD